MKKLIPKNIKLYNHVARVRKAQNFPPSVLAERVGINRSTLYKIEQGQVVPSVLIALKLGRYLHTALEELFSLEENKIMTEERPL